MTVKYADIAKAPKDILTEDFTNKVTLKCKKAAGPVAVTLETNRGSGGALSSKVGTKFSYAGLSFDKVQLTADGGQVLETSLAPMSGVKLHFKGGKGADLGVDYTKGNMLATGVLDVKDMSKVSTSACVGLNSGFTFGGDATYALSGKTGLSAYNLGCSYSKGKLFTSVTSASKLSSFDVGMIYKVNADLSLASSTTHSAEKAFTFNAVGATYKAPVGALKAKVATDGIVSACLIKEIAPKVSLTASGSVATSDLSSFKYGLGITM